VDLTDVILGLKVVVGFDPEGIHRTADVNDDGKIGVADVIHVLKKAGGLP
jgi:hypothetical protein